MHKPTLLITGGAGFIGSNLVRLALRQNYAVINVDLLTYAGNLASVTDVESHPDYTFVHADIGDKTVMQQLICDRKPQAILNLAAESHVDRSIDGPAEFIHTNVVGTSVLLEAARAFWRETGESGELLEVE